ncbi:hypothetical protein Peur_038981 [Populus x canadensis]
MLEEMENTLTDMIESGSSAPDLFTFNSVTGAYGSSGQQDKMEKWYAEFLLIGLRPDIKTFNILIRSYEKAGVYGKIKADDIETMEEYLSKTKHLRIKTNIITYCSIVSVYSKAGHIMKVDSILRQVENSDIILDTPFFNCVIRAYYTKLTGALHEDYCGRATLKYRVRILSFASTAAAMYAYDSVAVLVLRTGATARLPIEQKY